MNAVPKLLVLGLAAVLAGCDQKPSSSTPPSAAKDSAAPAPSPAKVTFSDFPVAPKPVVTPELVAHGKQIYAQNCAACHGEKGDAQGLCSAFLLPRPRNFTT
ncbi:MAG TPA: c-type cytochrome, partial [Candidatus Sulfotelmatobacter sp.]|nr:c-type cytochrome [Candidatus Sulfotelmatobacter sp.]